MKSFYPYPEEWTALLWMCETSVTDQNVVNSKVGRVGSLAIIRELLLHSKIDVNWEDTNCRTSMLLLKFSDKEPHVKKEIKEMLIEAGGRKWESTNCYVVSMVCKILWANCCKCCLPSRSQEMLRRMVLEDVEPIVSAEKAEENVSVAAILGLVFGGLSFFLLGLPFSLAGVTLSLIGIYYTSKKNKKGKVIAWIGYIVSLIALMLIIFSLFAI